MIMFIILKGLVGFPGQLKDLVSLCWEGLTRVSVACGRRSLPIKPWSPASPSLETVIIMSSHYGSCSCPLSHRCPSPHYLLGTCFSRSPRALLRHPFPLTLGGKCSKERRRQFWIGRVLSYLNPCLCHLSCPPYLQNLTQGLVHAAFKFSYKEFRRIGQSFVTRISCLTGCLEFILVAVREHIEQGDI